MLYCDVSLKLAFVVSFFGSFGTIFPMNHSMCRFAFMHFYQNSKIHKQTEKMSQLQMFENPKTYDIYIYIECDQDAGAYFSFFAKPKLVHISFCLVACVCVFFLLLLQTIPKCVQLSTCVPSSAHQITFDRTA